MTNNAPEKISFPITHEGSMAEHCAHLPDSISLSISDIKLILKASKGVDLESDQASLYLDEYFLQPNDEARDNGFCNEMAYVNSDGSVAIQAWVGRDDLAFVITGGIAAIKAAYEQNVAQHPRNESKEPDSLSV